MEAIPGFIRSRLLELMAKQAPDLGGLAHRLHRSPRTLQRRLAAGGQTFHGLADSVRLEQAKRLLVEAGTTVAELSRRLGYSTPRAFLRAFRRWTQTTPKRWRRSLDVLR